MNSANLGTGLVWSLNIKILSDCQMAHCTLLKKANIQVMARVLFQYSNGLINPVTRNGHVIGWTF